MSFIILFFISTAFAMELDPVKEIPLASFEFLKSDLDELLSIRESLKSASNDEEYETKCMRAFGTDYRFSFVAFSEKQGKGFDNRRFLGVRIPLTSEKASFIILTATIVCGKQ